LGSCPASRINEVSAISWRETTSKEKTMSTPVAEGASAAGPNADLTDIIAMMSVMPQILKTTSSPEETDKSVVD
jgi:hypothetical protein